MVAMLVESGGESERDQDAVMDIMALFDALEERAKMRHRKVSRCAVHTKPHVPNCPVCCLILVRQMLRNGRMKARKVQR